MHTAKSRSIEFNRTDPVEPTGTIEEQVREIFDLYSAELRGESKSATSWIFRRGIDHEMYVQAVVLLLHEAEQNGRAALSKSLSENSDVQYECSCRCKLHAHIRCAECFAIDRCQLHSNYGEDT